ncbi:PRC-barrel domain-containing protein [Microvirga roseola]|uniref:PRC-barrel domain-containing protein n=1 Tax=Microvirga roseola TaxID=2883126 RepID=UPI001E2842DE|nr:PRC-barrel domain-containing protein [Microvirga roseola]
MRIVVAVLPTVLMVATTMGSQPATAQGTPNPAQAAQQLMPGDVASAAKSAADTLTSSAKDSLLVKDLLGAQVSGPGGDTVGTVDNLVAVPGGRIVAAILVPQGQGGDRIPVPFSIVKVAKTSGKLGITLPVSLSELKGMKEVQQLVSAVPGLK